MTLDTYAGLFDIDLDIVSASIEGIRDLHMKAAAAASVGVLWGWAQKTRQKRQKTRKAGLSKGARGAT